MGGTDDGTSEATWSKGMFGGRTRRTAGGGRRRGGDDTNGAGEKGRRRPERPERRGHRGTLTELRWHQRLPLDGKEASRVSAAVCKAVLSSAPLMDNASLSRAMALMGEPLEPLRGGREVFVDCSTGVRLRTVSWGGARRDTVLMLHGLGSSADVWASAASQIVASTPLRCVAVDLRGHGRSARSTGGDYSIASLAADVVSLVVEMDLYARPVFVWGHDIGAAAALLAAAAHPRLFAGAVFSELSFSWPADHPLYFPGQGFALERVTEAERLLGAHAQWGHTPRVQAELRAFVRAAVVDLDAEAGHGGAAFRIDPLWRCEADATELQRAASKLRGVPALVLHGGRSHRVGAAAATRVGAAMGGCAPGGAQVEKVPGGDHWEAYAEGGESIDFALAFFERHAERQAVASKVRHDLISQKEQGKRHSYEKLVGLTSLTPRHHGLQCKDERLPEALGLRPLPQYATIEEARRALLPRRIPTKEGILAELNKLEAENGEVLTTSFDNSVTGLAKEDAEYFGFIG